MDADSEDAVYQRGTRIGTRLEPFSYGVLKPINLDILYDGELEPCPCGRKATLIDDGDMRFGVFCTDQNCPKCPTSYRYYWSWFSRAYRAVDEWNKKVTTLTETKTG